MREQEKENGHRLREAKMAESRLPAPDPDANVLNRKILFQFICRAGVESRVEFTQAKVLDALPQLGGPFDLAYIDAMKENGLAYGIKL